MTTSTPTFESALVAWLRTRPPIIQVASEFWPLESLVVVDNEHMRVFGWTETTESKLTGDPQDLMLILTDGDPFTDYDDAFARRIYVCARHIGVAVK